MLSVPDQRRKGHLTNDNAHYLSVLWAATAAWELGGGWSQTTLGPPLTHQKTTHSTGHKAHTCTPPLSCWKEGRRSSVQWQLPFWWLADQLTPAISKEWHEDDLLKRLFTIITHNHNCIWGNGGGVEFYTAVPLSAWSKCFVVCFFFNSPRNQVSSSRNFAQQHGMQFASLPKFIYAWGMCLICHNGVHQVGFFFCFFLSLLNAFGRCYVAGYTYDS